MDSLSPSVESNSLSASSPCWIIDSGATYHYSPNLDWFDYYVPISPPMDIRMGDSRVIKAIGRGNIVMQILVDDVWRTFFVENVYPVPDMAHSLLSVPQLTKSGCQLGFMDDISFNN